MQTNTFRTFTYFSLENVIKYQSFQKGKHYIKLQRIQIIEKTENDFSEKIITL